MIGIGILLGVLICLCLYFIIISPKLKRKFKEDTQLKEKEEELKESISILIERKGDLVNQCCELNTINDQLKIQREEIIQSNELLQVEIDKSNKKIYEAGHELMQTQLEAAAESERKKYQQAKQEYENAYLEVLKDIASSMDSTILSKKEVISALEQQIKIYKSQVNSLIDYFAKEEEKQLENNKYKILLSEEDLIEIKRLREIMPFFRNGRPIAKAIWESYYRNNCTEMINRVVGGKKTGIYKLTNITNQKSYIGQAVDIGERFKEHCKAGIGIDTPNSKLYHEMLTIGPENFLFEVLEECERDQLNAAEAHWISFFDTQKFGYNMTKGNK